MKKSFLTPALTTAFFLAALSAYSTPANRKLPGNYCPLASTIQAEVEDCDQNDKFIQQGDECLTRLEKEVEEAKKSLVQSFSANQEARQDGKFQAAAVDYKAGADKLAWLIDLTKLAIHDVSQYPNAITEPEDADEEDITGLPKQEYLNRAACYAETKKSLEGLTEDFKVVLEDLEAAKRAADQGNAISQGRKAGVGNDSAQKVVTGGRAGSAASGGNKKPVNTHSDVTGTKPKSGAPSH